MAKILFVLAAGCAVAAFYFRAEFLRVREKSVVYEGNNRLLLNKIRKVYDDKLAVEKKQAELEAAAKTCGLGFDWGYDISNSPVIRRLQSR